MGCLFIYGKITTESAENSTPPLPNIKKPSVSVKGHFFLANNWGVSLTLAGSVRAFLLK
jgi:hypothetical protein